MRDGIWYTGLVLYRSIQGVLGSMYVSIRGSQITLLGPLLACFHVQIGLEMTPQITLFGPFGTIGIRGCVGR